MTDLENFKVFFNNYKIKYEIDKYILGVGLIVKPDQGKESVEFDFDNDGKFRGID